MPGLREGSSVVGPVLLLLGCSSEGGGVEQRVQCIVGGDPQPSSLALESEEEMAIVALVDDPKMPGGLCSGVLVGSRVVLTASHCSAVVGDAPYVLFGTNTSCPDLVLQSVVLARHDQLDLLLLEVDREDHGATPLQVFLEGGESIPLHGAEVVLSGFGMDETSRRGARRFVSETVVDIDEDYLVVEGSRETGACSGDSGGPLLISPAGVPIVIGSLTAGSESCTGQDTYVRLQAAKTWFEEHLHSQ